MTATTCQACGQPVVVGSTRRGDWTALNPEPSESGTARLIDQSPWSPVVEFGPGDGERYEVHTCPPPECDGLCISSADVGVPGYGIAYAHPDCPLHNPREEV